MTGRNLIAAKEILLSMLLTEGQYVVPWHQRTYDWEKEHVNALLSDLADAAESETTVYFLGSIMLIGSAARDREWEINDGQQRTITFSLLCACLCQKLETEHGDDARGRQLRKILFTNSDSESDLNDCIPRISAPEKNRVNYKALIRQESVGSNGKIVDAYNEIKKFIDERQSVVQIRQFADFIIDKVVVVRLAVDESLDANSIFETLNHRGKYLRELDLIRNYVYSFFKSERQKAKRNTIRDHLENIRMSIEGKSDLRKDNVSLYVRCVLQCEYGFLQASRFFHEFKKKIAAMQNPRARADRIFLLVGKLAAPSDMQMFKTLLRDNVNIAAIDRIIVAARAKNSKRHLKQYLRDMRAYTITYPVVLALLSLYTASSNRQTARFVNKSCKVLSSFVQRIAHTQGDFRPSDYEKDLAILAYDIRAKRCQSADRVLARLQKMCREVDITDDKRYKELMLKTSFPSSTSKAKVILEGIVEYEQPDIVVKKGDATVDHILPQSHKHIGQWNFTENQHEECRHRLGNLALLSSKQNKPGERHNSSFSAKKPLFQQSSYAITRQLAELPAWNPEAVEQRQQDLAKLAATVWNFKID